MHDYNAIEAQIYYPRYIYIMLEPRVHYKLLIVVSQVPIIVQTIIPVIYGTAQM